MKYIVGIGEALWDLLPEGRKIGGAPANFAYHSSQFGYNSRVVSAIGSDELGDELIQQFDSKGVQYIIERLNYPTGTVQVELDANGVPQYEISQGVAWDNIPFTADIDRLAKETRCVCFGSLAQRSDVSRQTIHSFLEAMPDDSLRVFDINLRQAFYTPLTIVDSLERCNILKINDDELEVISKMFNLGDGDLQDRCSRIISKYNLDILILTCGVNGSYLFTSDLVSYIETPKVEVADTVGAGDSFTATFIASLLRGEELSKAHRRAVDVSAYVCTQHGAMPIIPEKYKM